MSQIMAQVVEIYKKESLHVVNFKHKNIPLVMVSLELENINIGDNVLLNIKATSVGIAKKFSGFFSYSNIIDSTILELTKGLLLTKVKLQISTDSFIESIIPTDSAIKLNLHAEDNVGVFINASDISIYRVLGR